MKKIIEFTVPNDLESIKVENFLRNHCCVSARLLTKLKQVENGITRNGELLRSIDFLNAGDVINLYFPDEDISVEPTEGNLEVLYEDTNVLVVDKPPYMPVHPVHNYRFNTLANIVAHYQIEHGEIYTFRAVNRLDRNTSGIVIIAKDRITASSLQQKVKKTYTAICEGELRGNGTIDAPIALKEGHNIQREVRSGGARAITHWRSIDVRCNHSLIELTLETGKTHQIRTHMSYIGHPLAGDDMYGGSLDYFERQCLHCSQAKFINICSNKEIIVDCAAKDFLEKFYKLT